MIRYNNFNSVKIVTAVFLLAGLYSQVVTAHAQPQTGSLEGRIVDASTGEPLQGAHIILEGTAIGTSSNEDGEFLLRNLPEGEQIFVVAYLGYHSEEIVVTILPNETLEYNIALQEQVVAGEELVIHAQALAQAEAIRRQLSSNTIVNVVSEARLRELADANAAEAIGRLPGVSIIRNAGEAQKVSIRGLAPKYNAVTVDGDRVTSTDLSDRSVDLSMISTEMLSGAEVYKVLRPDMDADAIGGSVNFSFSGAPSESQFRLSLSSGYHNHINGIGSYKGAASASGRFFDDRLGVLATVTSEQTDRSSHVFSGNYSILGDARPGDPHAPIETTGFQLIDRFEVRKRHGVGLNMDFEIPGGRLFLNNFYSRLDRDEVRARKTYNVSAGRVDWQLRDTDYELNAITSSLRGQHMFFNGQMNVDWRVSRNESRQNRPFDNWVNFRESGALNRDLYTTGMTPSEIPPAFRNNLDRTSLESLRHQTFDANERDYTASMDIEVPYRLGNQISGQLKFGGKHTDKDRYRVNRGYWIRNFMFVPRYRTYAILSRDYFPQERAEDGRPAIAPYVEDDPYSILDGQYEMRLHFDRDKINDVWNHDSDLYLRLFSDRVNDYDIVERVSAAYVMTELNVGNRLMILPGVRYEYENSDYQAIISDFATPYADDDEGWEQHEELLDEVTANRQVGMWFPMVQMRYRMLDWMDVRAARTQSTSRPNFNQLTPRRVINDDARTVNRGLPGLKLPKATNYDLILTLHSNRIGLFAVGGFYKEIEDLVFNRQTVALFPEEMGLPSGAAGFTVNEPMNNPNLTTVKGVEIEWQSNFRWLPSPFNGVVINANFTRVFSETDYPGFEVQRTPEGFVVVDTFRTAPMVHQPDHIANFSLGYDIRGFSVRTSMIYQGSTLTSIGSRPETDRFTDDYIRFDLNLKQDFYDGLFSVFMNVHNLNSRRDFSMQFTEQFPRAMEYYDMTMDLGIRFQF